MFEPRLPRRTQFPHLNDPVSRARGGAQVTDTPEQRPARQESQLRRRPGNACVSTPGRSVRDEGEARSRSRRSSQRFRPPANAPIDSRVCSGRGRAPIALRDRGQTQIDLAAGDRVARTHAPIRRLDGTRILQRGRRCARPRRPIEPDIRGLATPRGPAPARRVAAPAGRRVTMAATARSRTAAGASTCRR